MCAIIASLLLLFGGWELYLTGRGQKYVLAYQIEPGGIAKGEENEDFYNVSNNRRPFQLKMGLSHAVVGPGFLPGIVGPGRQPVEYPRKCGRPFP